MKSLATLAVTFAACTGISHGAALSLDGVDDWVEITNGTGIIPSGASPFTIGSWINPNVHSDNTITFWGNQAGNQANGFRLLGGNSARHYFWGNDTDRSFGQDLSPNGTGPNGDGWHHVAVTWDGSFTQWYWNGAPLGGPEAKAGVNVADANHRIGSRLGAEFFNGLIDEVSIWGVALSASDIAGGWNQPIDLSNPIVQQVLIAYYDFENGFNDGAALGGAQNGVAMGGAIIDLNANAPLVPEPTAAALGAIGALLLLRRRR